MIAASGGRLRIVSGYRSVERQAQLWANAVKRYGSEKAARKWVAPPGKSNHNHGAAGDIGPGKGLSKEQAYALIQQLAPKFGLHTPMPWEPWHVEEVDGESDPEAYTDPPDDFTPTDPTTEKMSILSNMLGGGSADPMEALMELVQGRAMETTTTGDPGIEVTGSGIQALVQAAKAAGFSGDALVTAVAVGMAESKGDPKARGVNKDKHKSVDRGLWQINDYWHKEVSDEEAYNPATNAQHAFRISGGGKNWTPWTTFKTGAYKQYIDDAQAAVGA